MCRADHRADIARIAHLVEVDAQVAGRLGPAAPVDPDGPCARAEGAHLVEQPRLHVLTRDQHELGLPRRIHQVLALGHEEIQLLPPAPVVELSDRLELVVVG
jgi:hypothetical protein